MGSITSGVGLVSGIDYQSMIDQLIALEAGPRDKLLTRVGTINAQKAAYLEISARITAMLARIEVLGRPTSYQTGKATSSLPDVLSASAGVGTPPGSYTFTVKSLASTHQLVSRGFHRTDAPLTPGTLTIESAAARVDQKTTLAELNGHTGIMRGSLEIENKAGNKATINVADALTVGDVIDRINEAGLDVTAELRGDGLVLTDHSGGSGALRVREVAGGRVAADLGFGTGHAYTTGTELVGREVIYLSEASPISALNDGLGLRTAVGGGDIKIAAGGKDISVDLSDILMTKTRLERMNHGQGVRLGRVRITARDSKFTEVDLSDARTIDDVKNKLEAAFGDGRITVVITGSHLVVKDSTKTDKLEPDQISDFKIEDVTGHAASDLGIAGQDEAGRIDGNDILHMDTLADVITAINYATNNEGPDKRPLVTATLAEDGHGLNLQTVSGKMTLKAGSHGTSSLQALFDLGFEEGEYFDLGGGALARGTRIVGGLDTVLLKSLAGGQGVKGRTLKIEANGKAAELDLSNAETLADVIRAINAATDGGELLGIEAGYDTTGRRLVVNNLAGSSPLTLSGDFAEELGLAQSGATIKSDNLQRRYVSESTELDDLNAGRGVSRGKLRITTRNGAYATLDLTSSSIHSLRDVIDAINALSINVTARINPTGDGLLITDESSGSGALKIEDESGTAAKDLNILGESEDGEIDGSYEFRLEIGGAETLSSLAERIGTETTLAKASVLNDGTALAPYRLSIASLVSGAGGALLIEDDGVGLDATTLTRAQDARIFFGDSAESGVLLTSATNEFRNVVQGLSLTVNSVGDDPVTVKVTRDIEALTTAMEGLVDDFNSVVDAIKDLTAYDEENEKLGLLQGESTIATVEDRLYRMFNVTERVSGSALRMSDLGLSFISGNRLSFNATKFREAYDADPEAVAAAFTEETRGLADQLKEKLEQITESDGLIASRTETFDQQSQLLEDRIDTLNERLDRKRVRLAREFQAMEAALAQMQSQQSTLANLASLAQNFFVGGTTSS